MRKTMLIIWIFIGISSAAILVTAIVILLIGDVEQINKIRLVIGISLPLLLLSICTSNAIYSDDEL